MKQVIHKEEMQSIYGEPSQSLTEHVQRTLRNLPEKQPRALSMRRMPVLAAALMMVIVLSTGAIAANGGWASIRQWLKQDAIETEAADEVLFETDEVRFVLVEKTLIGNQLVLAVLQQPKAPGMLVLPMESIGKSQTLVDPIMSLGIGERLRLNGFEDQDRGLTLQQYLEKYQLTPVVTQFMPIVVTGEETDPAVAWTSYKQDDGSVMSYITASPVERTEPLKLRICIGSISHETMRDEYGYLSSQVEWDKHRQWIARSIDVPTIANDVPTRLADTQTMTIERDNTTVTISDLKLMVSPSSSFSLSEQWSVQFHAEVTTDADIETIRIKPLWPGIDSRDHRNDWPFENFSHWAQAEQSAQRDYYYLQDKGFAEIPDALKIQISIKGYVQTMTIPLKVAEAP